MSNFWGSHQKFWVVTPLSVDVPVATLRVPLKSVVKAGASISDVNCPELDVP